MFIWLVALLILINEMADIRGDFFSVILIGGTGSIVIRGIIDAIKNIKSQKIKTKVEELKANRWEMALAGNTIFLTWFVILFILFPQYISPSAIKADKDFKYFANQIENSELREYVPEHIVARSYFLPKNTKEGGIIALSILNDIVCDFEDIDIESEDALAAFRDKWADRMSSIEAEIDYHYSQSRLLEAEIELVKIALIFEAILFIGVIYERYKQMVRRRNEIL